MLIHCICMCSTYTNQVQMFAVSTWSFSLPRSITILLAFFVILHGLCSHYNLHSVSFLLSTHAKTCTTTANVINISKPFSHLGSPFGRSRTWCICSMGLPLQGSFKTSSSSLLSCSFQFKNYKSIIFFSITPTYLFACLLRSTNYGNGQFIITFIL